MAYHHGSMQPTSLPFQWNIHMLYSFFWVIPRRLNFICWRFGILCSIFIGGWVWRRIGLRRLQYLYGKGFGRNQTFSRINTPTFSNLVILHTYPPMKMGQSVPKRRNIKFRRRGITQKNEYCIQNMVKVWNKKYTHLFHSLYFERVALSLWDRTFNTTNVHFLSLSEAACTTAIATSKEGVSLTTNAQAYCVPYTRAWTSLQEVCWPQVPRSWVSATPWISFLLVIHRGHVAEKPTYIFVTKLPVAIITHSEISPFK